MLAYASWIERVRESFAARPMPPRGRPAIIAAVKSAVIVSYDGTANDEDALALGRLLARGGAPRTRTVREILTVHRGDRWYNWRPDEPAVFAADTWSTVRSYLRRPSRKR